MRIEERREECDMTEHLNLKFLLALVILLLNLARMNFVRRDSSVFKIRASGVRTILLLAAVIQSHLDCQLKQSGKHLNTLTVLNIQLNKWNG